MEEDLLAAVVPLVIDGQERRREDEIFTIASHQYFMKLLCDVSNLARLVKLRSNY